MKDVHESWFCASGVFDGKVMLDDYAVKLTDGIVTSLAPQAEIGDSAPRNNIDGIITPGFFDIQVNGGGGVLFNTAPNKQGLAVISESLFAAGTTHWLPTVITDCPSVMASACDAILESFGTMGIIGVHIEGPHIALERKGTHKSHWIRPFDAHTLAQITRLRANNIPVLLTVAPETMKPGEVRSLVEMGVVISIGHTNANASQTVKTLNEGAQLFTHLFNAMSQIESRDLNVVGTAINSTDYCSIIADGLHVDLGLLGLAIRARPKQDRMILVTDAMPTVGGSDEFELYGNIIKLQNGRLINNEGSLAGAHITIVEEIKNLVEKVGIPLDQVLRMATSNPASLMGVDATIGTIRVGQKADLIAISPDLTRSYKLQ